MRGWLKRAFTRWVLGYGEKPTQILVDSLITIVAFGVGYQWLGRIDGRDELFPATPTDLLGSAIAGLPEPWAAWVGDFFVDLPFGTITFTTISSGARPITPPTRVGQTRKVPPTGPNPRHVSFTSDHPYAVAGVATYAAVVLASSFGVVALPDPTSVVWVLLGLSVLGLPRLVDRT